MIPCTVEYDVTTGRTIQIVKITNMHITEAQVSTDGQWVLFAGNVVLPNSPLLSKLQMVRMDGQGLQTLYCITADIAGTSGIYNVQWSPDQKTIVFDQDKEATPSSSGNMYLIDAGNGKIQLEIATPAYNLGDQPVTWLDNTRVFVDIDGQVQPFFILDTRKGANQQMSDLQGFVTSLFPCENIDRFVTSYDGTKLFLGHCTSNPNLTPVGPYSISVQPIGGTPHTIYTSPTLFAGEIRVISSTRLLLFISDHSSTTRTSQDGLWTMNIDGSNLKEVISFSEFDKAIGAVDASIQNDLIDNQFTRYAWSNASRDGSMYTVQTWLLTSDPPCKLLVSSLNGGPFTTVVSSNSSCDFDYAFQSPYGIGDTHLGMVGWTTM